jgi:lipopolysaccharide/colanic/teichoic acid biosynthesis glycosyltransferase
VQMIRLDIRYARQSSPWLDLEIISRTPTVVARQLLQRAGLVFASKHSNELG